MRGLSMLMLAGLLCVAAGAWAAPGPGAAPGVPQEERDTAGLGWDDLVSPADDLLARHDCLACHAPESELRRSLDPRLAPLVNGVVGRMSTEWLRRFLEDPRSLRPGTHHPHQLAALEDDARSEVVDDLMHFLARSGFRADSRPMEVKPILPYEAGAHTLERGRVLFHSVGCVACHGPLETVEQLEVSLAESQLIDWGKEESGGAAEDIPLRPGVLEPRITDLPPDLAVKYGPRELAAFLNTPVAQRPSGHCPSMSLRKPESVAIACYLIHHQSRRPGTVTERRPGLRYGAYEFEVKGDGAFMAMAQRQPNAAGATGTIGLALKPRDDSFAMEFSGWLEVPEDGAYSFHLRSDDGSRLYIDGELVVDNGGTHPPTTRSSEMELEFGLHAIHVQMYEAGGGEELSLEWEGPGIPRGEVPESAFSHWPLSMMPLAVDGSGAPAALEPFVVDQARVERGAEAFVRHGCSSCHWVKKGPTERAPAPSLEQIQGVRPGVLVCLRKGGRYDLDDAQVGMLLAAFVEATGASTAGRTPRGEVEHTMARRNCYACHRRDGIGGVHPDLAPYYKGDEDAELGDQGRFPPVLTAVGRKLRPGVLADAVAGNETVRPYLSTRMPRMGERNLERLTIALMAADSAPDEEPQLGEMCPPGAVEDGRRLAGDRGGLGCVQCHDFRGTASLGVRAVDMETMHRRLRFGWFRELLINPANVDLDGRMANLWVDGESPVESIADGDREAQIKRLWCWLAEGPDSMAPPPGLDTGPWAYEISPDDSTRLVSVFMEDVSPRVLCIGTTMGVHAAYDQERGRLSKAWRGRFLNVLGTWRGRAGALERPGSSDVFDFPGGLPIGMRPSLTFPWDESERALFRGRTLHTDGSVTLRYQLGQLDVAETVRATSVGLRISNEVEPELRPGVERSFEVRARVGTLEDSVIARVAVARRFERAGRGMWRTGEGDWPLFVVDEGGFQKAQVVLPEQFARGRNGQETSRIIDVRDRQASVLDGPDTDSPPAMEELRIPVVLRPSDDGRGDLIGQFSWTFAW